MRVTVRGGTPLGRDMEPGRCVQESEPPAKMMSGTSRLQVAVKAPLIGVLRVLYSSSFGYLSGKEET